MSLGADRNAKHSLLCRRTYTHPKRTAGDYTAPHGYSPWQLADIVAGAGRMNMHRATTTMFDDRIADAETIPHQQLAGSAYSLTHFVFHSFIALCVSCCVISDYTRTIVYFCS